MRSRTPTVRKASGVVQANAGAVLREGRRDRPGPQAHLDDLVDLVADLATGRVTPSTDPEKGPVEGACTPVNVAGGPATLRNYYETVASAVGVEPVWDEGPAWTGRYLVDRARAWGWAPTVDLGQALREITEGLRAEA